jgi:hypothetical protein
MLDNGYIYPGDVRLSAYRDSRRWAILIEALGFFYRVGLPSGIGTWIYGYGNCVEGAPGREEMLSHLAYEDEDEDAFSRVSPGVTEVRIRGHRVTIPRDPAVFTAKGIVREDPRTLRGAELLRVLLPEHREALLASEEERRRFLPPDLPLLLRLDAWHHPDLVNDELPGENGTFQALAEALVAGDPNRLVMTRPPNTHWRHWPQGGTL